MSAPSVWHGPVLRYVERLRSHDAALRLLARRRVEVYDALVPLVPARLGRRRGDLLSAVVDDVDAVVDRELRVRMPVRQAALVGLLAVILAGALLPLAGVILLTFLVAAGVGSHLLAKHGAFRAQASLIRHRSQLSAAVVESIQVADELRMWQAEERAADRIAAISARMGHESSAAAGWLGAARALVLTGAGAAMAGIAIVAGAAVAAGELSGPMMALLVLLPLALADVVAPVADAGALSVRTAAAEYRLHVLSRTAPAVRDTVAFGRPDGSDVEVRGARARWERGAPLTSAMNLRLAAGDRVAVVGPSGSGKSTLAALMLRFLDPVEGRVELGGQSVRNLPLDDVRRLDRPGRRPPAHLRHNAGRERSARLPQRQRCRRRGRDPPGPARRMARRPTGGSPHLARRWPRFCVGRRAGADRHRAVVPRQPTSAGARRADSPPRPRDGDRAGARGADR